MVEPFSEWVVVVVLLLRVFWEIRLTIAKGDVFCLCVALPTASECFGWGSC